MTQPKRLTEQQRKFAELLVYNEVKLSPAEAAMKQAIKLGLVRLHQKCVTQNTFLWL